MATGVSSRTSTSRLDHSVYQRTYVLSGSLPECVTAAVTCIAVLVVVRHLQAVQAACSLIEPPVAFLMLHLRRCVAFIMMLVTLHVVRFHCVWSIYGFQ